VHSAIVPSSSVRPAETSIQALGVKRTLGFVRACSELARHRELLARPASHSDDSSDEHDHLDASHRKVNTWLVCQPFLHQGAVRTSVDIGASAKLELVDKFCYLGDMLSVDGDADAAVEA